MSQDIPPEEQYFVADIELHTADELRTLLERAERVLIEGLASPTSDVKVTLVLHGPVLRNLLRENYLISKGMVDMAASLSAMGVIEVKACNTWMVSNGVDSAGLQPFIETVSYGSAEVERLLKKKNHFDF